MNLPSQDMRANRIPEDWSHCLETLRPVCEYLENSDIAKVLFELLESDFDALNRFLDHCPFLNQQRKASVIQEFLKLCVSKSGPDAVCSAVAEANIKACNRDSSARIARLLGVRLPKGPARFPESFQRSGVQPSAIELGAMDFMMLIHH